MLLETRDVFVDVKIQKNLSRCAVGVDHTDLRPAQFVALRGGQVLGILCGLPSVARWQADEPAQATVQCSWATAPETDAIPRG